MDENHVGMLGERLVEDGPDALVVGVAMLSLFTRKPKVPVEAEPVAPDPYIEAKSAKPVRRMKQQNIKASEDCCAAFSAIAEAQGH